MRITRLLVTVVAGAVLGAGGGVLATTPVTTSIEPANGLVDTETPVALTGHDFEPGMRLALVAGGGHRVHRMPLSNVTSIALAGEYAFVATYPSLYTLSLARPADPEYVGSRLLGGWPGFLRAADGRLFAGIYGGASGSRLRIFDAADPLLPVLAGEIDFNAPTTQFGYAHGFVYLPRAPRGFDVVDVENPAAPVTVARYRESGFRVEAIEVVGRRAYVAGMLTNTEGATYPILEILDVSSPAAPRLIASADLPGRLGRLAPLADGVLISHSQGLLVATYDGTYLAKTAAIRKGGSSPSFVATNGTCAAWFHGVVEMLDVSDPFAPVVRGRFPVPPDENGYGIPLAFHDGWVYWGRNDGLETYDACDPYAASPAHERAHRWGIRDIAFSADRVHYIDDLGQLHATGMLDPAAPRALGVTSGIAFGDRVALDGDLAYVAGQTWSWYDRGVLSIVDESVPVLMPVIGSLSLAGPPAALDADGPWVYSGGWSELWGGSLEIVDATRPREPRLAARIDGLARPWTITAADDALYYFSDWRLTTIDIRDRARPAVAGTMPGFGWPTDSARDGDLLFVTEITPFTTDSGKLKVLDVSSPFAPAVVAELPIEGFPAGVAVRDARVAVATDRSGVIVFRLDLGMPPRLTETLADTGAWVGLFDGFASVHRPGTWTVYPLSPPVENTSSSSGTCGESIVPAGIARGLYDVVTTCPHGHAFRFRDAYRACQRHELTAGLETFPVPSRPLPWRLVLDGDDHFFAAPGSHSAQLLLPELPAALETKYGTLGDPNRLAVVINLVPGLDSGTVNLLGDDRPALDKLWARLLAEGGIALRQRDERSYLDLQLSTSPQGLPGVDGRLVDQFVYIFEGSQLISASASGAGVDLYFRALGSDDIRCTTPAATSYGQGLVEACKKWGPHYPGMIPNCPW